VDLPSRDRVRTKELAHRLMDRLRGHAQDLGSADALDGVDDLLEHGNGGARQLVVFEANHDMREVVGEIVEASAPAAPAP
ncbi:MAG: carboxylate-amine ligase, partial [Actinomycetota bacterium]|nr:carboxylate-amine ligase [Actinomycetota bacterium]